MVQCDDCDDWHHFVCVGVDKRVESNPWRCVKCQKSVIKRRSFKRAEEEKQKPKATGKSSQEVVLKDTGATKKRGTTKQSKNLAEEQPHSSKAKKATSVKSATSHKSSRVQLELQLRKIEAERTLLEDKRKLIEQQYSILEELAELEEQEERVSGDSMDGDSKVQGWLRDKNNQGADADSTESSGEYPGTDGSEDDTGSSTEEEEEDEHQQADALNFNPVQRSTPRRTSKSQQRNTVTHSNQLNCSLSRNQLAARQVVAKDLPKFSGNSEE